MHKIARLLRTVLPIHARVLPLHRERTPVSDPVQRAHHLFERHVPATERADDAASMIDAANRNAKLRVIGAGALLATIVVAIATIFWLLRSRTIVRS